MTSMPSSLMEDWYDRLKQLNVSYDLLLLNGSRADSKTIHSAIHSAGFRRVVVLCPYPELDLLRLRDGSKLVSCENVRIIFETANFTIENVKKAIQAP